MSDEPKDLGEILRRMRKYASFYDWPDKRMKEYGIAQTFLEAMESNGDTRFRNPRPCESDPPDCVADDSDGGLVGIEVTELVDEDAVRINEQAQQREDRAYRPWHPEAVCTRIDKIINEKDSKEFQGGPYTRRLLVVHCDEAWINSPGFDLEPVRLKRACVTSQIDEAYLLLSYHPDPAAGKGYYPCIRLPVVREAGNA